MSTFNIGIYRIRNTVSNTAYYGSSKNISKRWKSHKRALHNNMHHNIYLQRSWNKHGDEIFVFERVEECLKETLFEVEQKYIDKNSGGYNIGSAGGGDNLSNHPDRERIIAQRVTACKLTILAMSYDDRQQRWARPGEKNGNWQDGGSSYKICPMCHENSIRIFANSCSGCQDRSGKHNPFYGRAHSDETRQKLRDISTGVVKSAETIEKLSGENSGRFAGYYHTPWGIFPSSSKAQHAHPYLLSNTIYNWCNNPDKIIIRLGKSQYLKENHANSVGMSYRDIGFWFEPKQPLVP
jgi:group I intron endonuclease